MDSLPNGVYPIFSFIGFLMSAIPLYWHMEAWNTGTCLAMGWVGVGCLMQCINSIIWSNNMADRRIYCLISVNIQAGLNVAISAASLCIVRRLYKIAAMKPMMTTRAERRRELMIDLLIGIGIPILEMIFYWIISSNVYNIFEEFGPSISFAVTPLSLILFSFPPLLICCVSFVYSCWCRGSFMTARTVYKLYKRERALEEILKASGFVSRSLYFRLMAYASVDLLGCIPLGTYVLIRNFQEGIEPWTGWANMHKDFSSVNQFPSSYWKSVPDIASSLEFFRWVLVAIAFVNFGFFGFAQEARHHYRLVYTWLTTKGRSGKRAVWVPVEDGVRSRPVQGQSSSKCAV
ncbi:GPCR fungal pheromone mating factor [Russula compacta]|nr:GPCR fungal pheromone mating factor [Russula compacta]